MSNKVTLNDINKINKILEESEYINENSQEEYILLIEEYIDNTFLRNDVIIEKLVRYCENSGRYLDVYFKSLPTIKLDVKDVANYILIVKKNLELILTKTNLFNFSIFVEIKSIVNYFLEKSYLYQSLINYETLFSINTKEFHEQNETFKYLYTIFDKFTYIARHLNQKYLQKELNLENEQSLKFFSDFLKDISFLVKSSSDFQGLSDVIELITYSRAWHFIRRLRNSIEHDFVDPTYRYNISLSINLLFIIISRVMISLYRFLKSNEDIKLVLEELKYSEKKDNSYE